MRENTGNSDKGFYPNATISTVQTCVSHDLYVVSLGRDIPLQESNSLNGRQVTTGKKSSRTGGFPVSHIVSEADNALDL